MLGACDLSVSVHASSTLFVSYAVIWLCHARDTHAGRCFSWVFQGAWSMRRSCVECASGTFSFGLSIHSSAQMKMTQLFEIAPLWCHEDGHRGVGSCSVCVYGKWSTFSWDPMAVLEGCLCYHAGVYLEACFCDAMFVLDYILVLLFVSLLWSLSFCVPLPVHNSVCCLHLYTHSLSSSRSSHRPLCFSKPPNLCDAVCMPWFVQCFVDCVEMLLSWNNYMLVWQLPCVSTPRHNFCKGPRLRKINHRAQYCGRSTRHPNIALDKAVLRIDVAKIESCSGPFRAWQCGRWPPCPCLLEQSNSI